MSISRIGRRACAAAVVVAATLLGAAAPGVAAGPAIALHVGAPDTVTAGARTRIVAVVQNVGDAPLSGNLTFTDTFPTELGVTDPNGQSCAPSGQTDTCTTPVDGLLPGGQVYFQIFAPVDPSATGTFANAIEVTGGGAPQDLTDQQQMTVGPPEPFAFKAFGTSLTDASGAPAVDGGSDPSDITANVSFPTRAATLFNFPLPFFVVSAPVEQFKDVITHLPPGLIGNPTATPVRCLGGQLTDPSPQSPDHLIPACPAESQVGIARIANSDLVPLYNMVPPPGVPAEFGFQYQDVPVVLDAKIRQQDNGIDVVARNASSSVPISAVAVTFWGNPSDSSHDNLRGLCLDGLQGNNGQTCPLQNASPSAFLRLPTSCTGPLPWSADASSFPHPDRFVHADTSSPALQNCDRIPFDPALSLTPTSLVPHTSSGLDVNLTLPQDVGPDGLAEADLRTATVTLPAGMTINPSSADGLQACDDANLRLGVDGAATCPDASKIGTVTLHTPLLDHPLSGSIFLRTQNSSDPASGELFRLAIEIRSDDDGVDLKLPGAIKADPNSGQLTTTFDNLPQLPFASMQLHFKSGPRAPLVSPRTCDEGSNRSQITLTSWSGKTVPSQDGFTLSADGHGAPCPASPFSPSFTAGTQNPVAGATTPFSLALARNDGDQLLSGLTVETPNGLLGYIKRVEQCSDATANAGTCGDGSLIGHATVGAGAGSNPFYITNGRVYLTGPYKGAPYGLSVVVHALAGPFDLGTVVVRAAIFIDKHTAALKVVSDALPTIVKGVPLNLRDVRVSIDRPQFIVNPTNCGVKHVGGSASSTEGATASLFARFQVGECKSLRFAPRISMSVGAKRRTRNGTSTPLTTTITQSAGQSNLKTVAVTLPGTLNALLPVVNRACKLAEFDAGHCTSKARVGSAVAVTPVLKDPLRGSAYFVKNPARVLPDLMIALRGPVSIDLTGKIAIPGGKRLATRFDTIPDAPITKFTLKLVAGVNGPIGVVSNLCTARARAATAAVGFRGQNGALVKVNQHLRINGCPKPKRR